MSKYVPKILRLVSKSEVIADVDHRADVVRCGCSLFGGVGEFVCQGCVALCCAALAVERDCCRWINFRRL